MVSFVKIIMQITAECLLFAYNALYFLVFWVVRLSLFSVVGVPTFSMKFSVRACISSLRMARATHARLSHRELYEKAIAVGDGRCSVLSSVSLIH